VVSQACGYYGLIAPLMCYKVFWMGGRKVSVLWYSSSGVICSSNCGVCLMSFELSVVVEGGLETRLVTYDLVPVR